MKTAIYIEDGTVQLVLTPEGEFEKNVLSSFEDKELEAAIFTGSFYDSRGGWIRQGAYRPAATWPGSSRGDKSLVIRIDAAKADSGGEE